VARWAPDAVKVFFDPHTIQIIHGYQFSGFFSAHVQTFSFHQHQSLFSS
jgi:hypothetical protein